MEIFTIRHKSKLIKSINFWIKKPHRVSLLAEDQGRPLNLFCNDLIMEVDLILKKSVIYADLALIFVT